METEQTHKSIKENWYDFTDFYYTIRKDGRKSKRYRNHCLACKKDRGYSFKNKILKEPLCHKCKMNDPLVKEKISKTSTGRKLNEESRKKKSESLINAHRRKAGLKPIIKQEELSNLKNHKRLKKNMRAILYHRLKKRGLSKFSKSTFNILGYTLEDLKKHLENKFQPGMTWENYGIEWHIDHIKPDSWFNYSSTEDLSFKECWSLSNLQPLWAKDNLKKGNRFVG